LENLLSIDLKLWKDETKEIREFYKKFGGRLPKELSNQLKKLEQQLNM
jgi:phosphoenolpyruvate carboxykinase (GTP)